MKNREQNKRKSGALMALLLFGLFAVCILIVLLSGADMYKRLAERDRAVYEKRTAAQYLTTKVRQADVDGQIDVEIFDGRNALTITEAIGGSVYKTWIYCSDGYIRELFAAADSGLTADAGEKILEIDALEIEKDGQIEIMIVAVDGTVQQLLLYPRSGREVSYEE